MSKSNQLSKIEKASGVIAQEVGRMLAANISELVSKVELASDFPFAGQREHRTNIWTYTADDGSMVVVGSIEVKLSNRAPVKPVTEPNEHPPHTLN